MILDATLGLTCACNHTYAKTNCACTHAETHTTGRHGRNLEKEGSHQVGALMQRAHSLIQTFQAFGTAVVANTRRVCVTGAIMAPGPRACLCSC